jgi:ribosomal protein S18 acetylase RimI-like enzyme
METMEQRNEILLMELLAIWEGSVRATHDFLTDSAIREIKPLVRKNLKEIERLTVCRNGSGKLSAFMGTDRGKIEMLFVAPEARGKGMGGQLTSHALRELGVRYVDVNEQNPRAAAFYQRFGFRVISRSRLDGQGNPFPILHMKLVQNPDEADRWTLLPSGILIRPYQPGEAGYVSCLHMRLYESQYNFRGIFEHYVLKGLADFTGNPEGGCLWTALDEKEIVGAIAIVLAEEGTAQLRWFIVHEDYQGKGIGKALMNVAMDFIHEKEYHKVFLWTIQTLEAARSLYGQYGFVKMEELPNTEWSDKELIEERWDLTLC